MVMMMYLKLCIQVCSAETPEHSVYHIPFALVHSNHSSLEKGVTLSEHRVKQDMLYCLIKSLWSPDILMVEWHTWLVTCLCALLRVSGQPVSHQMVVSQNTTRYHLIYFLILQLKEQKFREVLYKDFPQV